MAQMTASLCFRDSDKEPKPKKPTHTGSNESGSEVQAGLKGPALARGSPQKTRCEEIDWRSSWTGKLPVNILSEHCQKQKWEKPEYTMVSSAFFSRTIATFRSLNFNSPRRPRATHLWSSLRPEIQTQELVQLPPFKVPPTHKHLASKSTALEARHFAATYALFRVCSMRNIHMSSPLLSRLMERRF